MTNAVSDFTVFGNLTLSQKTVGSGGGASYGGTAGAGGNAASSLAYSDSASHAGMIESGSYA